MPIRNTKTGSWIYSKNQKGKAINRIKAIIFDLGNVLVDFDHMIAAKKVALYCDLNPEEIFNLFFDSQLTGLFEEGKISAYEFFLQVKETLHLRLDYDKFLPIWNEIFFLTAKNQEVYNLSKLLKKQYKLALLSNINILHFNYLKKHFSVFDTFHYIITSFEVGLRKPHPLIYQKTLQMLQASPSETFYTDDRSELVEEATILGIKGFCFKGTDKLKKDLKEVGIAR